MSKNKTLSDAKNAKNDEFVRNRRGIFEYVLGGEKDTRLLDVRVFDPKETNRLCEADGRRREEGRVELPILRRRTRCQREAHLEVQRNGRRSRYAMVERRCDRYHQLPDALQDAQLR